jgi:hypothetical protein
MRYQITGMSAETKTRAVEAARRVTEYDIVFPPTVSTSFGRLEPADIAGILDAMDTHLQVEVEEALDPHRGDGARARLLRTIEKHMHEQYETDHDRRPSYNVAGALDMAGKCIIRADQAMAGDEPIARRGSDWATARHYHELARLWLMRAEDANSESRRQLAEARRALA